MIGVIDDTGIADRDCVVILLPGALVDSVALRDALNGLRGPDVVTGGTDKDDLVGVDLLSVLAGDDMVTGAGLNAAVQCARETLCVGQSINATN